MTFDLEKKCMKDAVRGMTAIKMLVAAHSGLLDSSELSAAWAGIDLVDQTISVLHSAIKVANDWPENWLTR